MTNLKILLKNFLVKIGVLRKIPRCYGRCDGNFDLCFADMTCKDHDVEGCEICYGKRVEYKWNF